MLYRCSKQSRRKIPGEIRDEIRRVYLISEASIREDKGYFKLKSDLEIADRDDDNL